VIRTELSVGVISGLAYGKEFKTCVCCQRKFCSNCCSQSTCPIVERLWHPDGKKKSTDADPTGRYGIVCDNHQRKVAVAYMLQLHDEVASVDMKTLQLYLAGSAVRALEKPTHFTESAIAMRLAKLACTVAKYTGYGAYAKALKYAMMSRATLALLLNKDVTNMLFSLMPLLEEFDLKTPNDMLCVYYLGCKTELQRKHQADMGDPGAIAGQGVIAAQCPDDILELLGRNVAYAQWLYAAALPPPHDSKEWGAWYLSRILEREGWQLVASHVDSAELPDGSLCPAFALVVRDGPRGEGHGTVSGEGAAGTGAAASDGLGGGGKKEAILVIRGSRNLTDWRINVTRKVTTFAYRSGPCGAGLAVGGVHTGMLIAARAILGK
jgi:hypothetical protein